MPPPFVETEVIVNPGRTSSVELRVKPLGVVLGTVENLTTDSLLKGVRVQLLDANGTRVQEALTDDEGSYRFSNLSGGTYTVRVILPKGYLLQGDPERTADVSGGSEARIDFQVFRHGSIQGRVLTEDGQPLGDAEVELIDSTGAVLRTTRTDAQGVYAFPDVPVDKYKVRVVVPEAFEG